MAGLGRSLYCAAGCSSSSDRVTHTGHEKTCITTQPVTHACNSGMHVLSAEAPRRSNSGTSSHKPARFPVTLSARNCRTPVSMLRGSQGMGLVRFLVVCASMVDSGLGR